MVSMKDSKALPSGYQVNDLPSYRLVVILSPSEASHSLYLVVKIKDKWLFSF